MAQYRWSGVDSLNIWQSEFYCVYCTNFTYHWTTCVTHECTTLVANDICPDPTTWPWYGVVVLQCIVNLQNHKHSWWLMYISSWILPSPDHHKKARHFWWANGAETNQLQMFLLFPAEYRRYKEQAAELLKLIESEREKRREKVIRFYNSCDCLLITVASHLLDRRGSCGETNISTTCRCVFCISRGVSCDHVTPGYTLFYSIHN